jgi:hypothetical protein
MIKFMTFEEWLEDNPIQECDECEVGFAGSSCDCAYMQVANNKYQIQLSIDKDKATEAGLID